MVRFQLYKDKVSQWRWRSLAANNEIIASGESYWNKSDCLNAIRIVQGAFLAPVHEL